MRQESLLLHRDIKRMAKYLEVPDESTYMLPSVSPESDSNKRHFQDHNILGELRNSDGRNIRYILEITKNKNLHISGKLRRIWICLCLCLQILVFILLLILVADGDSTAQAGGIAHQMGQ